MNPIHAARSGVVALVALTLGGCYYTSPYGYAPYYTPVPATVTQRETPVAPGAAVASPNAASSTAPADADVDVAPAPVYVAPAYPAPYPYYYPAYYPGWYGPPVAIGFGFWGGWGGHWRGHGGHWGRPWGGGHWGGGHRH